MKQLEQETIKTAPECAQDVLEVVPLVMAAIRATMRAHRAADLSVPQFRTLAYLDRRPGVSLGDVADHIGLTLSSLSKIVDDLVGRGLVTRAAAPNDRRYVTLTLTQAGVAMLGTMRRATQADLAVILDQLSEEDQAAVSQAMRALRRVFGTQEGRREHGDSRN